LSHLKFKYTSIQHLSTVSCIFIVNLNRTKNLYSQNLLNTLLMVSPTLRNSPLWYESFCRSLIWHDVIFYPIENVRTRHLSINRSWTSTTIKHLTMFQENSHHTYKPNSMIKILSSSGFELHHNTVLFFTIKV